MNKCENCGREMEAVEDYANGDANATFCKVCLKKDGSLRTYKEFRNILVVHLLTKEGKELTKQLGFEEATTQEEAEKLSDWVMKTMSDNVPEISKKKDEK